MKRIYTDADLYNEEEATIVIESADLLLGRLRMELRTEHIELHFELVLEIVEMNGSKSCGYYFVDHRFKVIFWLEEFDVSPICKDVGAVLSHSHLREYIKHKLGLYCMLIISPRLSIRMPILVRYLLAFFGLFCSISAGCTGNCSQLTV